MIKYENPYFFNFFWIVLIIFLIMLLSQKIYKKNLNNLISNKLLKDLYFSYNPFKSKIRKILLLLSISSLIMAVVNPKIGTSFIELKREGIDIVIALDLSRSMLAEDITPNRIDKAKFEIRNFIRNIKTDRVGLVGFTSQAFIQCPLTTDYDAILMFLDLMNIGFMPQDGTSLKEAINVSVSAFNEEEDKYKMIILISDGEDHEEGLDEAIQYAVKNGVVIATIGIGSLSGTPIPINGNYIRDKNNNIVITRLNEYILKKIAADTKGNYYLATSNNRDLKDIFEDIANMEKKEFDSTVYGDYEDRFQFFLMLALLFLGIEFFISSIKTSKEIKKLRV